MFGRAVGYVLALGLCATAARSAPAAHVSRNAVFSAARQLEPTPLGPLKRHPVVALTFDDLPAAGGIPKGDSRTAILGRLAAVLKANHLKGTYGFVVGSDVNDDPDTRRSLRVWTADGMNLGNHTWDHPSLNDETAAAYEREIALVEPYLREYSRKNNWKWLRYPYLEEGNSLEKRDQVLAWLHARGYRVARVSLNFQDDDWSDPYNRCLAKHDGAAIAWLKQSYMENAAEFIRVGRQEQQIAFGHEIPNVLLLHATAFTTLMLPQVIELLRQEGFRFESLARVERNPVYSLNLGAPADGSWPDQFLNARHLAYPSFVPEPVAKLDSVCR